ncbi:unnamed protein product [Dovyalis caffra]|uniref:DC1 domain-containing protein n=1 Tax=Dovyalis caffra TaxID=77055 RepID=A0AAV1R8Z5_9ROSI|nr:unnamed protein product [Dovyalis caffra]
MKGINYLERFSDEHQLMLIEKVDKDNLALCKVCKDYCHDPYYYSCSVCVFNLHDMCANLPSWYSNPFHLHKLLSFQTNVIGEPEQCQCHACSRDIDGYTHGYKCEECDVYLDVECALLRPTIKEDEDRDVDEDLPRCYFCWEFIISSVEFYKREPCRFYLHKSCAELKLPEELSHFYRRCPLTLCTKRNSYNCKACLQNRNGFHCLCFKCNFRLDSNCSLLPEKMKSEGQDLYCHPTHGHPLTLVDVTDDEAIQCVACQKSNCDKTYVCRWGGTCKFFLHQWCFDLPPWISNPYFPAGPKLELTPECFPKARCRVCYYLWNGLFYRPPSILSKKQQKNSVALTFNVHVKCPVEVSTIAYQAHPHNLIFIENTIDNDMTDIKNGYKCSACGKDCISSSRLFRCVKCNYSLHLECGPLPCIIPYKSQLHTHPLRLTDSPVDEEYNPDMDVFCFDECEKEREPRLPVYCCSEGCPFIAEIKCVISEVKRSLLGDYGDVELKSSITKMAGRVIGQNYVPQAQYQELRWDSGTNDEDCNKIASRFTRQDTDFYRSISKAARLWESQASLEALDDVTPAESILRDSPAGYYFRFMLCFNIQFALDRLDRIVLSSYGLEAKAEYENLEKMDKEIIELDQDIKELEAILVEKRARLLALQKRRGHAASKETLDSSLIDKCLGEASELKWWTGGEALSLSKLRFWMIVIYAANLHYEKQETGISYTKLHT